ncbi:MAG: hypothetical protein PHW60_03915 [Kiritimatiellae bacterium]|nr:hypothetical protein [Kiritimatiellia bacterium]
MNIKDLLAKIVKGEALTDEEKAFVADYDPEKVVNSTAAAVRKSAEAKLREKEADLEKLKADIVALKAEADKKADANKPELEKLAGEVDNLKKSLAEKDTAFQSLESEKRQLIRNGKLGKIMAGLKFVDGLDPEIPRLALERALAVIDDANLDSADQVMPIVEKFRASNKAILADTSGYGGGGHPKDSSGAPGGLTMTKINNMSPAEFLKQKDAIWAAEQKGTLK